MSNKEKFKALVSAEKANTVERNRERIKNRAMLKESQNIALKILVKLDEPGWSQIRLAKEMDVTPQQVNKIVRGKENLTLETQVKLQSILDIPILASYYENKAQKFEELLLAFEKTEQYAVAKQAFNNYHPHNVVKLSSKVIKFDFNKPMNKYSYQAVGS